MSAGNRDDRRSAVGAAPPGGRIGFRLVLGLAVAAGGSTWGWQRNEVAALQAERAQARREAEEWTRQQAELAERRATRIGAEALERLRSDRAALPRLRAELERLRAGER